MTEEKYEFSDFCHTTAAELRQSTFFSEKCYFCQKLITEKSMGLHTQKISHATAVELRLITFFCKADVIFLWLNLMNYDTEKVLVSTESLLW